MPWRSEAQGGGSGTIDTTARALAQAAADRLNQIFPVSGNTVSSGSVASITTTDAGTVLFSNPTSADITVPDSPSVADLQAAGLVLDTGAAASAPVEHIETLTTDGTQTITLTGLVAASGTTLLINGVEQLETAYTVVNGKVTLPASLDLYAGDTVEIHYFT